MHNAIPKNFRGLLILYVTASMTGGENCPPLYQKYDLFRLYIFSTVCSSNTVTFVEKLQSSLSIMDGRFSHSKSRGHVNPLTF